MKQYWNERYSQKQFAYGVNPNEYLKVKLPEIEVGSILFPAEGEGRNAIFAASIGWEVSAFDQSEEGKKKAAFLANKNAVQIDYTVSDVEHISYPENSFDALVFIYAHFPSEKRKKYHQKLVSYLKKGGVLILEGFSKNHLENQKLNSNAGGPKDVEMLYDLEELKSDFEEFYFIEAFEGTLDLSEGLYHNGRASIIRILATKQ